MEKVSNLLIYPKTEDGVKLSPELGVRPLRKNEVAKYKLIDSDKDDLSRTEVVDNIETNKHLKRTPGYTMVGKKEIFDPILGERVTIINKITTKNIKTALGDVKTTRPLSVKFLSDKPIVTVPWNEPDTYAFLERADENIDNPYRDPRVKPMYYRVDPVKKAEKDLEKDAFEYQALKWVQEHAKYDDVVKCIEHLKKARPDLKIKNDYTNAEASVGFNLMKRALFELAKTDPKNVLKGSSNESALLEMQIRDAERFNFIMFSEGGKTKTRDQSWFHTDENLTIICTVPIGKNKYEALMQFFKGEKPYEDAPGAAEHYTKMVKSLTLALTPR